MTQETSFDLLIVGGGPGGTTAAERAAAAGLRVALVERGPLGGTCLNAGCIPSKALLHAAKLYSQVKQGRHFGVLADNLRFDVTLATARQERIIHTLREGLQSQMARRGVQVFSGAAQFIDARRVRLGETILSGQASILALGAAPRRLAIPGADLPHVIDTSQALRLEHLPERVVIVGSDVLVSVFASILAMLGCEVSVVHPQAALLPMLEAEQVSALRQELRAVDFLLGAQPLEVLPDAMRVLHEGAERLLPCDAVLVCDGRTPNVDGLAELGLDVHEGRVVVDEFMRINLPQVYAVGDLNGLSMWAHSAMRMGEVAVNHLLGRPDRLRTHALPTVIYAYPELASVGLTEAQARAAGRQVQTAKLPMSANGRFLTENEGKRGVCKVVVDGPSQQLLGVHLMGGNASEMIFGFAAMLEDEFRVADVQQVLFAHPTIGEIVKDALHELR